MIFLDEKKLPCSWSQSRIRFLSFHNREGSNPPTNSTSKYTTWFQCQQDVYKISNRRLRDVETMPCVYWAIIYQSSHFIASLHQSSLPGVNLLFFKKQQPEVLYKKGVLKDFVNFTRKQLCWSLFLLRQEISTLAIILKKSADKMPWPFKELLSLFGEEKKDRGSAMNFREVEKRSKVPLLKFFWSEDLILPRIWKHFMLIGTWNGTMTRNNINLL